MSSNGKAVIMQILPSLESGGVERGVVDLVKSLKRKGYESVVVSTGGKMVYQLKEASITHINLPVHSKNPIQIYLNIKRLTDLIAKFKVDIIHARSRAPMISAYFACKKTNTKLVSTVHGTYSSKFLWQKDSKIKRAYNAMMLKADRVIAVSHFIKQYIDSNYDFVDSSKISVIQRGLDLKYFDPNIVSSHRIIQLMKMWNVPEDKKIILMPARITAWKGHEFVIDALSTVRSDFFCVMVGSDHGHKKFRQRLEQKIIIKGLCDRIRIVGNCKDMPAAYAISHFVLCPSIRPEAFGRIAIEAQASRKLMIATDLGGYKETIQDGIQGFLVEPNDVSGLANAIEKALLMSKDELDSFGDRGMSNAKDNFSSEKMCAKTIELYKNLLSS